MSSQYQHEPQLKKEQEVPRLWTKDFLLIIFANLFVFVSFQMLLPTMPLYVEYLGASEDVVGMVMGVLTITAVVLRPFAGRALDSQGRRVVYLFGLAIITLSIFAYSLVSTVAMLLVMRLFHGIGWGTASTAAGTIATDIIPRSRLGEGMGFYGLTSVFSMAVAPIIGLQVIQSWGFDHLFYSSAFLVIAGAIFALLITYQKFPAASPESKKVPGSLFEKSAYLPALIIFFITLTYGSIITFIALYAKQFGIENIGFFFTFYALTLLVSRPYFGRMADKKGYDFAMLPGIICVGLTMVILFFAQNYLFFVAAAICYGIGFGAVQPSLQSMAVGKVSPQRRGAANGTFLSGFDLGIGIGAMIWGYVVKVLGYNIMYLMGIIPVLIAFVLYLMLIRKPSLQ